MKKYSSFYYIKYACGNTDFTRQKDSRAFKMDLNLNEDFTIFKQINMSGLEQSRSESPQ